MRKVRAALAVAVVVGVALALPALPAGAAGMTTHAWMAESAIDLVDDADLAELLRAHVEQVRAGARFPDGGYGPGLHHGEEAHWQRFADAYAEIIRGKPCGDLSDPDGPCAAEIAHLMGVVAHGTGDEVWDWLFEPYSPDLGEYYLPEDLSPFQDGGGQELVMDLVAIGVHGRPGGAPPPLPSVPDLLAAFEAAGLSGVTEQHLRDGQTYIDVVHRAEAFWVPLHLEGVLEAMPWMSANLVTAPGGVEYAARAIAGQWDAMWGRLHGDPPPTEVSITHPADGQRGVPATGWVRTYQPGSHPGRGGARTRIAASLTHALPFDRPGQPAGVTVPPGSMGITVRDTGAPVPLMSGYPRAVPYSPSAGEHTIAVQPAVDLAPCTWYRVEVTAALLDADGRPVVPHSWEFRTGLDADGTACPDDPPAADVVDAYVARAHHDLLGRAPTPAERARWVGDLLGGRATPDDLATELVGSADHRRRLSEAVVVTHLGRAPTPAELDVWEQALALIDLDEARALLLGSDAVLAHAGGPQGWVEHVYRTAFHRDPTAAERTWWTGVVRSGGSRTAVARLALSQPDAAAATARAVTSELLGRPPTPEELATGTDLVAGSDARALLRWLVSRPPYSPFG